MKNEKNFEEMQILEQNLQNLMLQRQAFQMELSETELALNELNKSKEDDSYKIVGQLMIKFPKSKIIEELTNKKKILDLRLNAIEKQEESLSKNIEKIREKLLGESSE